MRSPLVAAILATLPLPLPLPLPAQSQSLPERQAACLSCHGENGQSQNPEVPSLGGQPEYYVTIQLVMFRDKLRAVDIMNQVMTDASDDAVRELASFVSRLPPPEPVLDTSDSARMERAKELARQNHCGVCHKPDFSGGQNVPRLAGQREDYLVKALRGYKDNSRRGYDASMADVIEPLTDEQMLDMAYYLARVR
jgi:cytochrome c553